MEYTETFSIADPLYEMGIFRTESGRDIYSEVFGGEEEFGRLYERLINSFEINRLNFLKQAGLLYLIFPSATHTRFAHALGCFILGTYAMENIWVKEDKTLIRLEQYLMKRQLREEFLIALLIHDIGHLPFSHYLEDNVIVKSVYGNHEKIGFDLLNKNSTLYKLLLKKADENNSETIVQIIDSLQSVDIKKILLLLEETNPDPPSQLVCGYLDLDRLDHYFRDSFFMGLKLASLNIKGFLNAIVIENEPDEPRFVIRSDGIPHILHLLFGREMLWQRAFDNDVNRAYQSMCLRALDNFLREDTEKKLHELPFMTEDMLISELFSCESSKKIMNLIFSRRPYKLMFKEQVNMTEKQIRSAFNEWLKKEADDPDDFLLFIPRNFNNPPNEWLLSNIPILEGKSLYDIHGDLIDYFNKQNMFRSKTIRIFAKDKKLAEAGSVSISKIFK